MCWYWNRRIEGTLGTRHQSKPSALTLTTGLRSCFLWILVKWFLRGLEFPLLASWAGGGRSPEEEEEEEHTARTLATLAAQSGAAASWRIQLNAQFKRFISG